MNPPIIVIAEQTDNEIAPVTYELIAAARILRQLTDSAIKVLITGSGPTEAIRNIAEQTGLDILVINAGIRGIPDEIIYKYLPASLLSNLNPSYICMAHTSCGLETAPGIAVKTNGACITGVEKISQQDDRICFSRSVFSDRLTARLSHPSGPCVLTIGPGFFKPDDSVNGMAGKISMFELPLSADDYDFRGYQKSAVDTSALKDADVIVSAGNGVREKEHLGLIYQLADLFSKSAVTGSRPICDKKWLKYSQQVGVTGATVKPKLYIACGISGSSQHISGMRESKFIVSINTDPHAAIFNFSDVCIIEDLTTFIPQFIKAYAESR